MEHPERIRESLEDCHKQAFMLLTLIGDMTQEDEVKKLGLETHIKKLRNDVKKICSLL